MMYKIGICDDCAADIRYIDSLVTNWAAASGNTVVITTFPSAEAFLFHYAEKQDFDILLLDIEMGGQNGVELAKKIRQDNDCIQIIFITGFSDFMAEGYEVAALHYLMKPVSVDKLYSVLDRAAANLTKTERRLRVVFDRESDFVPFSKIMYVEAQKQYVLIHTCDHIYRMKTSLMETKAQLDEYFFQCQRSFLVNLSYVVRIKKDCVVLKNGEEIPISRGLAEKIGKAIIQLF